MKISYRPTLVTKLQTIRD